MDGKHSAYLKGFFDGLWELGHRQKELPPSVTKRLTVLANEGKSPHEAAVIIYNEMLKEPRTKAGSLD